MRTKTRLNALCLALTPLFGLASLYFLGVHHYAYSLLALLGIVACMETRVRLGYRSRRGAFFAMHLACASALVAALLLLIAHSLSVWAYPLAVASFIGMAATGAVLIRRTWHSAAYSVAQPHARD